MFIHEVSKLVSRQKRCGIALQIADGPTKFGYVVNTPTGDKVFIVDPQGYPRPWEFTLEELQSDQWIAADRP